MNSRARSTRRDPENIVFARDQRARVNEFAQDVWQIVRSRQCRNQKFRREYPIPPYMADFCCVALKLIVEIDGEDHQTDDGKARDAARDKFLAEQGYEVLRIPGYQVAQDPAAVRRQIESTIDDRLDALGDTELPLGGLGDRADTAKRAIVDLAPAEARGRGALRGAACFSLGSS